MQDDKLDTSCIDFSIVENTKLRARIKLILKYRSDFTLEELVKQDYSVVNTEFRWCEAYERFDIGMWAIPKDAKFNEYILISVPFRLSFRNWHSYAKRLTYMEYIYCLKNSKIIEN